MASAWCVICDLVYILFFVTKCLFWSTLKQFHMTYHGGVCLSVWMSKTDYTSIQSRMQPNKNMLVLICNLGVCSTNKQVWFWYIVQTCAWEKMKFNLPVWNATSSCTYPTCIVLESVQDFLIKLDMKPCMHLVEKSIFSQNHDIVRPTQIMNRPDKNWTHF